MNKPDHVEDADQRRMLRMSIALESISDIGTSDRLDICQAKLHGVMACAKEALGRNAQRDAGVKV